MYCTHRLFRGLLATAQPPTEGFGSFQLFLCCCKHFCPLFSDDPELLCCCKPGGPLDAASNSYAGNCHWLSLFAIKLCSTGNSRTTWKGPNFLVGMKWWIWFLLWVPICFWYCCRCACTPCMSTGGGSSFLVLSFLHAVEARRRGEDFRTLENS